MCLVICFEVFCAEQIIAKPLCFMQNEKPPMEVKTFTKHPTIIKAFNYGCI